MLSRVAAPQARVASYSIAACFRRWSSSSTNVVTDMKDRGLVADITSPDIIKHTQSPTTIYCGVDPTARSLHLGNLVTLMGLLHFGIRGHQAIALVGGATGSIGDPSGRKSERVPLGPEALEQNVAGIEKQMHRFFQNGSVYASARGFSDAVKPPKVLNNFAWFSNMTALQFLGDVGRYARVSTMLGKESVKTRLASDQGISFTEFSYQLLQAYDFYYLNRHHECQIQLGGSDQWGNITAGIDMINKRREVDGNGSENASRAYGITIPLLLTSSGEKFGKSAGNAVWLDPTMTSIFDFYQFFMRTTDVDVGRYLPMFTLLSAQQVEEIMQEHMKNPEKREAQRVLANEATELVHGSDGLRDAQTATKVLFGGDLSTIKGQDIVSAFRNDPGRFSMVSKTDFIGNTLAGISAISKATASKSAASKLIKSGGMYLNNTKVTDVVYKLSEADLMDNEVCVLRTGKSSYHIIHVA